MTRLLARVLLVWLIIGWVVVTRRHVGVWQNEVALWTNATVWAPAKPRPAINLGAAWDRVGDHGQAWAAYQLAEALVSQPGRTLADTVTASVLVEGNLARLDLIAGHAASAQVRLAPIVDIWPPLLGPQYTYALALAMQGECRAAAPHMAKVPQFSFARWCP